MKCAIIYDFDGTLAKGDCAQHGLMPALGISANEVAGFWDRVNDFSQQEDADEVAAYLWKLLEKARQVGKTAALSKESLRNFGKEIPLFDGVAEWFTRINDYARKNDIALSHYIISSGLEEMIYGTAIAGRFQKIYACRYLYDQQGEAVWPAVSINYTTKTQFLFRINKGIDNCWNNESVNRFVEMDRRPMPFSRMIYIGDGDTDIPAMKMVKSQGGFSLAVFDKDKWAQGETQQKVQKLISEERSNYVVPADYSEHSQLDVTVKGIMQWMKRKNATLY